MQLSESSYNEILNEVKNHLIDHPNRFAHILGVVEMSELLANKYGVDPLKAKIAAVLHDYSKYDDNYEILSIEEQEYCKKYPYLGHAYLSYMEAKNKFGIDDNDILNAIKNHVVGRTDMSVLEAIIFIADFTEKNRTYDDCIKCREILLNQGLKEAIVYSCESSIAHSKDAHPNQLDVLKKFKESL